VEMAEEKKLTNQLELLKKQLSQQASTGTLIVNSKDLTVVSSSGDFATNSATAGVLGELLNSTRSLLEQTDRTKQLLTRITVFSSRDKSQYVILLANFYIVVIKKLAPTSESNTNPTSSSPSSSISPSTVNTNIGNSGSSSWWKKSKKIGVNTLWV